MEDVATPQAWAKDKALVLRFYDERRAQVIKASPNQGHIGLVELEQHYDVHIVTQNIDDLHERAGSSKVLHLHGEIMKSRSTIDESLVYNVSGPTIPLGATCELGSQLRPHIVWFGEAVPKLQEAAEIVASADVLIIVGTSLNVYPAAGLVHAVKKGCLVYAIDPNPLPISENVIHIMEKASTGVSTVARSISERTTD